MCLRNHKEMASKLFCCFGWNINEDQYLEKELSKRHKIIPQQQQKTSSNTATNSDEEFIRQNAIQTPLNDIEHVTSKVIIKNHKK